MGRIETATFKTNGGLVDLRLDRIESISKTDQMNVVRTFSGDVVDAIKGNELSEAAVEAWHSWLANN